MAQWIEHNFNEFCSLFSSHIILRWPWGSSCSFFTHWTLLYLLHTDDKLWYTEYFRVCAQHFMFVTQTRVSRHHCCARNKKIMIITPTPRSLQWVLLYGGREHNCYQSTQWQAQPHLTVEIKYINNQMSKISTQFLFCFESQLWRTLSFHGISIFFLCLITLLCALML